MNDDQNKTNNNDVVNVMGNSDNVSKSPEEIRKSFPSQEGKSKFSAEQMSGDPEEFKRPGSTPAQGDDQTADDEVNDQDNVNLNVDK